MAPLVTTLVRTYNHARFIREAVSGVQMQVLSGPHAIVVIDDFSTDGTRDILTEIWSQDRKRIRLVFLERNEFSNRALAAEVESSQGVCTAFVDGDDCWTDSNKLQSQVDAIQDHPECVLSFHNALVVDEEGVASRPYLGTERPTTAQLRDILQRNFIPNCTAVVRTTACRSLPRWYLTAPYEDWPLWIIAATHGDIRYLNRLMANYREHAKGLWTGSSRARRIAWDVELFEQLAAAFADRPEKTTVDCRLWQKRYDLAVELEREGDIASVAVCLKRCLTGPGKEALARHFAPLAISPGKAWSLIKRKHALYSRPWLTRLRYLLPWPDEALPEVPEQPL